MKTPVFSFDEKVDRLLGRELIVQLINRRNYFYGSGQWELELDTLWVSRPENKKTASLGYNNGFLTGMDAIRNHYATAVSTDVGSAMMQAASTPLVFIADDGQTARYLGYRFGFITKQDPQDAAEAETYMDVGLMFADLLLEDGEWKLWHLVIEHDHTFTAGEDYSALPVRRTECIDPLEEALPTPNLKRDVYQPLFGWEYLWRDMPKPYPSYTPEESYGPDGVLGIPYYACERRLK